MSQQSNEWELIFEDVQDHGKGKKKIGRLRSTGKIGLEISLDDRGREVEKIFYDDDGNLTRRVVYELDNERKPKLTVVYNATGKVIWRQVRGSRPEDLSDS